MRVTAPKKASGPDDVDRKQITLLYVADLHAQLESHRELFWSNGEERIEEAGGFARVAAAVREIRQERNGHVLVLDGGDTIQGSAEAAMTEGRAVVDALNGIGLDIGVPGNWESLMAPRPCERGRRSSNIPSLPRMCAIKRRASASFGRG